MIKQALIITISNAILVIQATTVNYKFWKVPNTI